METWLALCFYTAGFIYYGAGILLAIRSLHSG